MGANAQIARHFGANLRRARRQAGLSQEEAGLRASLHHTEIGLLERGERVPRIETVVKLAGALGVKFRCPLLAGLEWRPGSVRRGSFSATTDPREGSGG